MKTSSRTTLPARANQYLPGIPLSQLLSSAIFHLEQFVAGNCDEAHADLLIWNVRAFERTRQDIADGKLPIELADHADDSLSVLRTAIQH
jgi:hypothetical protein